jgi:glycosyltransferase involved in cell wall biosynthesis
MNIQQILGTPAKKKVLLRGPVLTQSGYGVHARQVAKWLLSRSDVELEIQALPWGDTPWLINGNLEGGLIGRILEKTVDPSGKFYDVSVQLQLPNEWDPKLGRRNIGITAGIETDRCNPEWISACNAMDLVVVPSRHAADSLSSNGSITVPICIVPESYPETLPQGNPTRVDDLKFSTPFNFLIFGQLTGNNPENDRKNIFYTVKWLCEVFKDDRDVGIIIKTNSGRNTSIDRKIINQTFNNLVNEVRKGEYPRLHLLHGDLSNDEVGSLYKHPSVKALVSLTKGEGYGLPLLEASACGLPVIATGWSGHIDFLSRGKFIDIAYRLDAIHPTRVDGKLFMGGSRWAYPSEEDFKKKILKFRSGSTIPREWAKSLQEKILKEYSIDSIISMYNEITREIL